MIALDTNLLVYAYREDSEFHTTTVEQLRPVIEGDSPWALPWTCVHEFIGVVTSGRVYKPASPLSNVLGFLGSLMASPQLHLLSESPGYFEKLRELALAAKLSGPRIHDARIAALCLHHGVRELWTADRDFTMFPKLKTRNPLVKKMKTDATKKLSGEGFKRAWPPLIKMDESVKAKVGKLFKL